jgi:hypothetical protein
MNFIIAIGGTGIRCLESFIYLCTIGMCDGMEFNVLMLDTDIQNGNKERVNNLIDNYNAIKGTNPTPTYKTFFSARINKHVFTPAYDPANGNFQLLANLANPTNRDLADLFFDEDSQNFNLEHGYRAQTQIGSYLMYHGIVEAVRRFVNNQDNAGQELVDFINKVYQAGQNARIFIMGSVFGGTGASSIPIIPRAIDHAIRIIDGAGQLSPNSMKSCVLLTNYFKFNPATAVQTGIERVIADAGKFAINSQAALMFYEDDTTVRNTYNIMYHIGYPYDPINFDDGRPQGTPVRTGGVAQTNPAHILELLAASAAHDFFKRNQQALLQLKREIVYKTIDEQNDHLVYSPANFFPNEDSLFRKKLASFYLLNFFLKDVGWDLNNFLRTIRKDNNVRRYNGLEGEQQLDSLNEIIRKFGFHIASNLEAGWLWQLKQSIDSTLFFNPESYVNKRNVISEFNYGKLLKNIDIVFTNFWYRSPYDRIKRRFLKSGPSQEQNVVSPIECLLAQFYNTFDKLI